MANVVVDNRFPIPHTAGTLPAVNSASTRFVVGVEGDGTCTGAFTSLFPVLGALVISLCAATLYVHQSTHLVSRASHIVSFFTTDRLPMPAIASAGTFQLRSRVYPTLTSAWLS